MQAWRVVYAIWLREVKLFLRERTRIVGALGQPVLYLLIVGQGIAAGLALRGSPDVNYMLFMYPGILGMSALFTSMFSAISIIWDREFGFLKEVLVAPAPRWSVALGKVLGGSTVATMQSAILILLAPLVGVWPSPLTVLALLGFCFLISCSMTGLGVAIAARMRSMQGFQMVMNFLVMPIYFLSGAMFQVELAPAWMKWLMSVDPLTYGVDGLRNVVFGAAPAADKAGLVRLDAGADAAIVAAVAVVLVAFAAFRFNAAD
jgi:ABC-2 type transport system permease protein